MTDPDAHLPIDHLVELLSAELDGEFDAAARDLGYTPEDARARLAATPSAGDHRSAMSHAREALAVPTLDDDVRARLVAQAVAYAPRDELATRRRRWYDPRLLGSVAAAALVVVGIAAAISTRGPGGGDDSSAGSADMTLELDESAGDSAAGDDTGADAPESAATMSAPFAFGDVSDADALRSQVQGQVDLGRLSYSSREGTFDAEQDDTSDGDGRDSQFLAGGFPVDDACVATQADAIGATLVPLPVLRGPATYDGQTVEVLVFATESAYEAVVIALDCSVLDRVSVPLPG